jgi:hypothetical protein
MIKKMLEIKSLDENKQALLIDNLWKDSSTLWDVVKNEYERNKKIWQNNPEWLADVPRKRSKARDNRTFLAMESVINTLTGRPSKPNVVNIIDTPEARQLSDDMQDVFIQKYADLQIKSKMRKGLRFLFLSRFMCLKIVWDNDKNDFDVMTVDSREVRVSKKCTSVYDTKFAIENVTDITLKDLISKFPDKEGDILKESGYTIERLLIDNPTTEYKEAWIDGHVFYKYKDKILYSEPHPYWDWTGMKMTKLELMGVKKGNLKLFRGIKKSQAERLTASKPKEEGGKGKNYENFLYNYFDNPIPPYIFGTALAIENRPVGESSLMNQVEPLQTEIDKRKRQISDNTEMANGQYKIDTALVSITKAEAQAAKSDPRGIWMGRGVSNGISIMTGRDLPMMVKDDLNHSIVELDNIFGTGPTFRGEQNANETAMGRAILREQSYSRLDEFIDLMDNLHQQLYSWMYQMMRVRYTEAHLTKITGRETAQRIISFTQNSFQEGIKIKIIPGQILPQDRLFKAERAKEEFKMGAIDPLTYFEDTERDNPVESAKRVIMFKINPASVLNFTPEELQKMGKQTLPASPAPKDPQAQKIQILRKQAEELANSPEFQKLPPDKQEAAIQEIEDRIKASQQQTA